MSAHLNVARIGDADPLTVRIVTDLAGKSEYPASPALNVAIHLGRSVRMSCSRGGEKHSGISVHGDTDIVPPWTASVWEPDQADTALVMSIDLALIKQVAAELDIHWDRVEFWNRF